MFRISFFEAIILLLAAAFYFISLFAAAIGIYMVLRFRGPKRNIGVNLSLVFIFAAASISSLGGDFSVGDLIVGFMLPVVSLAFMAWSLSQKDKRRAWPVFLVSLMALLGGLFLNARPNISLSTQKLTTTEDINLTYQNYGWPFFGEKAVLFDSAEKPADNSYSGENGWFFPSAEYHKLPAHSLPFGIGSTKIKLSNDLPAGIFSVSALIGRGFWQSWPLRDSDPEEGPPSDPVLVITAPDGHIGRDYAREALLAAVHDAYAQRIIGLSGPEKYKKISPISDDVVKDIWLKNDRWCLIAKAKMSVEIQATVCIPALRDGRETALFHITDAKFMEFALTDPKASKEVERIHASAARALELFKAKNPEMKDARFATIKDEDAPWYIEGAHYSENSQEWRITRALADISPSEFTDWFSYTLGPDNSVEVR